MPESLKSYIDPEKLYPLALDFAVGLVSAVVIFIIGRWVAKLIARLLERGVMKAHGDTTLASFLSNIAYAALLVAVIIAALAELGFQTTSLLAIFGAAGLAIGLALQGSLSNFAAGVMLIVFRPFKAGDWIEAAGISGSVDTIRVFNTVLTTGDNIEITVPNGKILDGVIKNTTARETRRIDLSVGIGYDDDIDKAESVIRQVLDDESRVLGDPAPVIRVETLGDSSVNIQVRPWVKTSDFWPTRAALLKRLKVELEAAGLSIPYPQRDVHLYRVDDQAA